MEEKLYMLDEDNIGFFADLIPTDPDKWVSPERISIGMMYSGRPAAILTVTVNEISVFLDWIYVRDEYRYLGFGTELISELLRSSEDLVGDRYIHVACDNELRSFFEKNGFEFSEEEKYTTYTTTLEEMTGMELPEADSSVIGLHALSNADLNKMHDVLYHEPDIPIGVDLPFSVQEYMPESAVCIRDGRIKAMLFLEKMGDAINISYVYEAGNDVKSLFQTVAYSFEKISMEYEDDTPVTATVLNNRAGVLFTQLFGEAEEKTVCSGKKAAY